MCELDRFKKEIDIESIHVLFAGLLDNAGQLGPAEIPKRENSLRICLWYAKSRKIEMKLPPYHPFNPLTPLRVTIALKNDIRSIKEIFNYIWKFGNDIDDKVKFDLFTKNLGIKNYLSVINNEKIKQQLRQNTLEATKKGVFGVPTFVVDNQIFWGMDSGDFFLNYLNQKKVICEKIFAPVSQFRQGKYQRKKFRK